MYLQLLFSVNLNFTYHGFPQPVLFTKNPSLRFGSLIGKIGLGNPWLCKIRLTFLCKVVVNIYFLVYNLQNGKR